MKANRKQGWYSRDNRFYAVSLHNMLKSKSERKFPVGGGKPRSGLMGGAALKNKSAPFARNFSLVEKCDLKSANDTAISRPMESLRDRDVLPVQQTAIDEGGLCTKKIQFRTGDFASILPLDHPLVVSYVSSLQQDFRMVYVSPQLANLGFAPEMLLGNMDFRLRQVHEDDSELVAQALQRSRSTGEKFNCHYRIYDGSGNVRWFHDEASVICDDAGVPVFIKGVMLDITDKKGMEAELNEHRYYLDRNVERRTSNLRKRIELLEACNASLCDWLSSARMEIAMLNKKLQLSEPDAGGTCYSLEPSPC